jgi:uroporphyrinogen-III decarboxylase
MLVPDGGADKNCTRTKALMTHQPAVLHALLSHLADALGVYAAHQVDAGAQVVQLFDSWAHHLSRPVPRVQPALRGARHGSRARAHRNVPLIFHANGSAGKERSLVGCSANVIGLEFGN